MELAITPRVPGCNSARAAQMSYPTPEARAAAKRSKPISQKQRLRGHRRAERSFSTFKVRRGCGKIPFILGKEQWLRFAGAALNR